jgi:hypothetical protein
LFFLGRRCSSVETGFSGQIALRAVSGTLASYGERAALVGKVEEWAKLQSIVVATRWLRSTVAGASTKVFRLAETRKEADDQNRYCPRRRALD